MTRETLSAAVRDVLLTPEPREKVMAARAVARNWRLGRLEFAFDASVPDRPARPDRPELLPPRDMPRRGKGAHRTRVALWHSLAHIEFNAIDLALDIIGRFGAEMGREFCDDFLSVAADEAMHFALLERRLRAMGSYYGALPAHDGLWQSAQDTGHDVAARLAIVPMVLEARGLDVTPNMVERLRDADDEPGARLLQRILDDEIAHVRFGATHFEKWCERHRKQPILEWQRLVKTYFKGRLKGPFNDSARRQAGLSRQYLHGIV